MSGIETSKEPKEGQVHACESCMNTVIQTFGHLQEQNRTLKQDKAKLEKELQKLKKENNTLEKKVAKLKKTPDS